ncbi:MFS transporter [Caldimonas brevitalea]|uniref:MFS transporter n=1 Tax=Caldimonas brevitalea TaxID=413882 RepID=A0A0G3BJ30_9BURK|nr:MFS transporter [Caldimonas brevitalea]AKJ29454.1 MFS transporter [Caldimonas brevitalea]
MSRPDTLAAALPSGPPINERALLLTLAGIQFTHIVDFMVMMPLGPQFTRLFGITDAQFGLLVSAYTLAAGASGLVASLFIDRFERKRLLLWLYAGFALSTLACGLAPGYALLLIARVLAGVFGGVMGTLVQTMVGDAIPFERRGAAMGLVMSAFALSTVAGVPGSLWLAGALGWQAPFIAIAVASAVIGALGLRTLPPLAGHMEAGRERGAWRPLLQVLGEANHWRAFALTAMIMAGGFAIIPFLTIYMTTNMGLADAQVPLVYLAGGVATLFTSRAVGRAADRWGKMQVFRVVAAAALLPMLAITHLHEVPLAVLLVITTLFFVLVSGRFVPGMALITAAAAPSLRGTFMSLNGAVQSAAMGLASLAGGLLIGRDAQGRVSGFEFCGWIAAVLTLAALWWVGRLQVADATSAR